MSYAPRSGDDKPAVRERFGSHLLDPDEITCDYLLGEGAFGKVWSASVRGSTVAVKIPKKQFLSDEQYKAFLSEVDIMKSINHTNICLFLGACVRPGNIRIATEQLRGDLHGLVMDTKKYPNSRLPLSQRMKFALDASLGVAWLHNNIPTVIHRDLKLANMLVRTAVPILPTYIFEVRHVARGELVTHAWQYDANSTVKVCDFGLSQFQEDETSRDLRPKGSPLYQAPEVLARSDITKKVDVYAFGIILWELVNRSRAFPHHKAYNPFKNAILSGERPPIPADCLPSLSELMQQCWAERAEDRPTMEEVGERLKSIVEECKVMEAAAVVDKRVRDPTFAEFWKKEFLPYVMEKKLDVDWKEFSRLMYRHFNIEEPVDPLSAPLPDDVGEDQVKEASDEQLQEFIRSNRGDFLTRDLIEAEIAAREEQSTTVTTKSGYKYKQFSVNIMDMSMAQHMLLSAKLVFADTNGKVKLAHFGHVGSCLGPFEPGMLERISRLMSERHFYGIPDVKSADSCLPFLEHEDPGTYLVLHIPVVYHADTGKYEAGEPAEMYDSLKDIIQSFDVLRVAAKAHPMLKDLKGFDYDE